MRSASSRAFFAMSWLMATIAGCASATPPAPTRLPKPSVPTAAITVAPTFQAVALTGRHELRRAVVGPGGRVYAATMDELFVFAPGNPTTGDRFPFHGPLLTPPGGSRLYRTDHKELVELDASGSDVRKATFGTDIDAVGFSRTGALIAVTIHDRPGAYVIVIVRASDLGEVARVQALLPYGWSERLVWSPDDAYVVVGNRVIDTQTAAVVYEHGGLHASAILFEGGRLHWLFQDLLESVDLAKKTSTQAWLPCNGESRAKPSEHRFITGCAAQTITTIVSGDKPAFTRAPAGPLDDELTRGAERDDRWAPERPAVDLHFSSNIRSRLLIEGKGMVVRDGELRVPARGAPDTLAARVRLGTSPAIVQPDLTVEIHDGKIVVRRAGGTVADFAFTPFVPVKERVAVVGDKVVLWETGWNPAEPLRNAHVCSFGGACEAKLAKVQFLGLFGDDLVGTRLGISGPVLVLEDVQTGVKTELAIPVTPTALVRSEDGALFVGLRSTSDRPKAALFSVDAKTGRVSAMVETDDPSYKGALFLGVVGDRVVVAPDFGNHAEVVLHDVRSLREMEHYFVGQDATLHVRDDGAFETTGEAASLENLIVCSDGRRFAPPARCKRPSH